jgi:hypothetical protein
MTVRAWGVGLLVALVGGVAAAEPPTGGLPGLEQELGSTGKIGVYAPRVSTQIAPAAPEADSAGLVPPPPVEREATSDRTDRTAILSEEELRKTDPPVAGCRVEVARRRQIAVEKLAAKQVIVRFTVLADGRVRDAETVSAQETDLEVAACAKRVLSEWLFAKHAGAPVKARRTYKF